MSTVAIGTLWSSCRITVSPLASVNVVYVSRGHLSEHSRPTEIDLATGGEKALVDWPALNYNPAYSPDAAEIAFTSNITGDWVVYRQRLSDGQSWRVTFGPGPARSPDYRP